MHTELIKLCGVSAVLCLTLAASGCGGGSGGPASSIPGQQAPDGVPDTPDTGPGGEPGDMTGATPSDTTPDSEPGPHERFLWRRGR